jgi:hypothetical protein
MVLGHVSHLSDEDERETGARDVERITIGKSEDLTV